MPFNFMQFVTPGHIANPTAAVGNAINALNSNQVNALHKQQLQQQGQQFEQEFERNAQNDWYNRRKDALAFLDKYNDILATQPELAPQYESLMKFMGFQFQPSDQPKPADVISPPGGTTTEAAPSEGPKPAPQAAPQEEPTPPEMTPRKENRPAPTPPLLSRYMKTLPPMESETETIQPPEEVQQEIQRQAAPISPLMSAVVGMDPRLAQIQAPAPPAQVQVTPPQVEVQKTPTATGVSVKQAATVAAPVTPAETNAATTAVKMNAPRLQPYRVSFMGQDLGTFDPESNRQRLLKQAQESARAYTGATVERYRPLIDAIMAGAKTPQEINERMKVFGTPEILKLLGDEAAIAAARGRGGVQQTKLVSEEFDRGRAFVSEIVSKEPGYKIAKQAAVALPAALKLLESDNPVQQMAGLRELAKAMNGSGVLTDADADAPTKALPLFERLKNEGSKLFFGHMSEEVRQDLIATTRARLESAQGVVDDVRDNVIASAEYADEVSPQYQKGIRSEYAKQGLGDPNALKFGRHYEPAPKKPTPPASPEVKKKRPAFLQ